MKPSAVVSSLTLSGALKESTLNYGLVFLAGLIAPLGFAPFHLPGLLLLSLAFLFNQIHKNSLKQAVFQSFVYGIGYFGAGVSWIIISIHDYGQLNYAIAGFFTLLFILMQASYPALVAYAYKRLCWNHQALLNALLFSALWCLSEWLRATLFTGFPWLLIGTPLIDTPIKYLVPLCGVYGLSLLSAFLAASLVFGFQETSYKRYLYLSLVALLLITPAILKNTQWTHTQSAPIQIGAVQANLSMRNKWDKALFFSILNHYQKSILQLISKDLIILPESAIPLPASYLENYLHKLNKRLLKTKTALILGITTTDNEDNYYNSALGLGYAKGENHKKHLVPFGEYIPGPFLTLNRWLGLPEPNLLPGPQNQPLIRIANHPIASLICYEIAYPNLLRKQMPGAQWIVSISDNGWFGRSLASYQQLQMAQVLSLLTSRYQIVVNNDGLSSIIDTQGNIVEHLPAFSAGILEGTIYPTIGQTPWVWWYEYPAFLFIFLILSTRLFHLFKPLRTYTRKEL